MPKKQYVPKHRNAPIKPARKGLRSVAVTSGVAVAATGIAVTAGVATTNTPLDKGSMAVAAGPAHEQKPLTQSELSDREQRASRSTVDRRALASRVKRESLSSDSGVAHTHSEDLTSADPRTLAEALMPQYGMSGSEFGCLDSLWNSESGWNIHADNPTSSAYGIPQALPGAKMASAGPDWENNPETQIKWGLGYIRSSYGTPCSAWSFKQSHGFY